MFNIYIKATLVVIDITLNNKHGIIKIKATTIGNNFNQQNDINWSNLILGNEALIHINVNIIKQDFIPKNNPYKDPSNILLSNKENCLK